MYKFIRIEPGFIFNTTCSESGMIENLDGKEIIVEGFEKYSDHRIITFAMILRKEIKTVKKCTYHYMNADVI